MWCITSWAVLRGLPSESPSSPPQLPWLSLLSFQWCAYLQHCLQWGMASVHQRCVAQQVCMRMLSCPHDTRHPMPPDRWSHNASHVCCLVELAILLFLLQNSTQILTTGISVDTKHFAETWVCKDWWRDEKFFRLLICSLALRRQTNGTCCLGRECSGPTISPRLVIIFLLSQEIPEQP